jgi:hypothetical protein
MMFRFGRKPVRHTGRTRRSLMVMRTTLEALGPAPWATANYIAAVHTQAPGGWSMFLNDQLGDCVCADSGHTLMLRSANTGAIIMPTDVEIEQLYEEVGGYDPSQTQPYGSNPTDQGCDETTMEQFLTSTGFCGQKLDDSGMVDYTNSDHLVWAIQLFGSVRLGINFPNWAMDAFNAKQPWGAPPGGADTTIEGGHDICLVDFRGGVFTAITWGQEQAVTMDFLNLYCEEAHAELAYDWIMAQGLSPSGFSLAQLNADLSAINS